MKRFFAVFAVVFAVTAVVYTAYFIGTGFFERSDVALLEYYVSETGEAITLKTAIASSMGHTRGFKDSGGGEKPHYLTFYSAFGGLNGSVGAKEEFVLELGENDSEIYFRQTDGGYRLVLRKDTETGKWIRP